MAVGIPVSELDGNRVLSELPLDERTQLATQLERYQAVHEVLTPAGGKITHVHFPTDGLISIVAAMGDGRRAEVGTVDRQGVTGVSLFLGSATSMYEIVSQVAGTGLRMAAEPFLAQAERSAGFRGRLMLSAEARMVMLGQTAACNASHAIRQRLARWLLLSHDSVLSDEFVLTHEFLSHMLGAERPTVSVAAGALQKAGLITYRRGEVTVKDRRKLERAACECYEIVRRETERLMGGARFPH